jgi:transcription initiation factor IIE alpha subunit
MITIPQSFIDELTLNLDEAAIKELSEHFTSTLEERVGNEILTYLTDEEIEAYNKVLDTNDDAKIQQWLVDNVPDLNEIINDEAELLIEEMRTGAPTTE